jgi:hypothetical protein
MKSRNGFVALFTLLTALSAFAASDSKAPSRDPFDQSQVPIEVQPTDPKLVKIVLVAGAASTSPTGEHEYFAGSVVLMNLLRQTPGVFPVLARDGWPKDPQTFKDAKAVVFYMDGGGKQPILQHMNDVQKLADAGIGIVHLHQVIDYPTEPGKQAMKWLGGVYDPTSGARGHWVESFNSFPDHPVTRGVEPFSERDGWILRLSFLPDMKGITPLVRTTQLSPKPKPTDKPAKPTDPIVAWTYDRPDGGRSFVFTGAHEHKYWALPGLRRLVVNGIPSAGAPVALDEADLKLNLDKKPEKPVKAAKAAK